MLLFNNIENCSSSNIVGDDDIQRCIFGQNKIEGTLIGLVFIGIAVAGILNGWLGFWGYLIWIPLITLGLVFVCFIGHFLVFAPILMFLEYIDRKRER
jgi:hypothetical protein